jgi:uncharacterized protein YjbJ (UPF0337 family)
MDKDRVVGAAHRVKGAAKEAVGKVTGDAKTEAEGAAEKAAARCRTQSAAPKTPFANLRRNNEGQPVLKTFIAAAALAVVSIPAFAQQPAPECGGGPHLHRDAGRDHRDQLL